MLLGLAAAAVASVAIGSGSGIGTFAMFTEPVEYRLEIFTRAEDGFPTRVPLREVRPHLSRDARRVLGGAHRFVVGETNARLLASGLGDLAKLTCRLRPDATFAEVRLERRQLDGAASPTAIVRGRCHGTGRAR